MRIRIVVSAASLVVLSLLVGRAVETRAQDDGRPVLDNAVKKSEAAAEATITAEEDAADAAEAGADQEQAETIKEEAKEQGQERQLLPTGGPAPPRDDGGLVDQLVQSLGVTHAQAAGGAGAIFSVAKQKLSASDYAKVAAAAPGSDKLLAQAPIAAKGAPANEAGGLGGAVGGMAGGVGATGGTAALGGKLGAADQFGGVASLAAPFSQLGMSPEMAGKFLPVVLEYVQSNGSNEAMGLLADAFK